MSTVNKLTLVKTKIKDKLPSRAKKESDKAAPVTDAPEESKNDPANKNRRKTAFIAVLIIIIVLGTAIGSYFVFIKSDSSKSSQGQSISKDWVSYKDPH